MLILALTGLKHNQYISVTEENYQLNDVNEATVVIAHSYYTKVFISCIIYNLTSFIYKIA